MANKPKKQPVANKKVSTKPVQATTKQTGKKTIKETSKKTVPNKIQTKAMPKSTKPTQPKKSVTPKTVKTEQVQVYPTFIVSDCGCAECTCHLPWYKRIWASIKNTFGF